MQPLISIVVPIYNVEIHLSFCLESIKAQTYKNLQVILINDGSLDNSESICKIYCNKDSRFEYYSKSHEGLGKARNFGIQLVKGDYTMFLDSDDAIHPSQIEILYNLLIENPECSFSKAMYTRFMDETDINFEETENIHSQIISNKEAISRMLTANGGEMVLSTQACWNKLYRTTSIKPYKFHKLAPGEDIFFNSHYYPSISSFVETDAKLYYYRFNPTSITSTPNLNFNLINAARICDIYESIKNTDINLRDEALQCIVRKILNVRYFIKNSLEEEQIRKYRIIKEKYIPLYFKSKDSFKNKCAIAVLYFFPITYRMLRSYLEWKAK